MLLLFSNVVKVTVVKSHACTPEIFQDPDTFLDGIRDKSITGFRKYSDPSECRMGLRWSSEPAIEFAS